LGRAFEAFAADGTFEVRSAMRSVPKPVKGGR